LIVSALCWLSAGLTTASCLYLLLALAAVAFHRPQAGPGWAVAPHVTLLKPLCGLETGLEEAIESFLSQKTTFPVRFIFGVADREDPALDAVRKIAARYSGSSFEFVIDPTIRGSNPKVSNLINMAEVGLGDVVAISDSDIIIAPGTLQTAIDTLGTPGVGAVTTLYRARPGLPCDPVRSFGAWYIDYWDLPTQMLYARLASPSVTYGPLTAIRGRVLDQIGGLSALANHLCDDAELGRLVRSAGHKIALTPAVAETLVNDAGIRQLFNHELRWARTTRGLVPVGYAASIVTNIGPVPLLLLLHPSVVGYAAITSPVLLRWLLATLIARRFGKASELATPGPIGLWLRDCACFVIWAAAFVVGRVSWRGKQLPVQGGDIVCRDRPLATPAI